MPLRGAGIGVYPIPEDFIVEVLTRGGGLDLTAIAFAPNGRVFLAERSGLIWSWEEVTGDIELQLDIQEDVYENGRRGVESMVVDEEGRLFILYAASDVDDFEQAGAFGRVVRYDLDSEGYSVEENTKLVLLGENYSDGIPACSDAYSLGKIRLGKDGTLLIATSDAADHNQVDSGGEHGACFGDGRLKNEEDIGAYRAQSLNSLAGKILRIDANTGDGLPSNPYFSGSRTRIESKIWAKGLREPAGLIAWPAHLSSDHPGAVVVADRGWQVMEELNISLSAGADFGWPCMDGLEPAEEYPVGPLGSTFCAEEESDEPAYWWHHQNAAFSNPSGLAGTRFGDMTLYEGTQYPSFYNGRIFYSDEGRGWLANRIVEFRGRISGSAAFFHSGRSSA